MTGLLLVWPLCGWTSFCIGSIILDPCSALKTDRPGDRQRAILWLGFSCLGSLAEREDVMLLSPREGPRGVFRRN